MKPEVDGELPKYSTGELKFRANIYSQMPDLPLLRGRESKSKAHSDSHSLTPSRGNDADEIGLERAQTGMQRVAREDGHYDDAMQKLLSMQRYLASQEQPDDKHHHQHHTEEGR